MSLRNTNTTSQVHAFTMFTLIIHLFSYWPHKRNQDNVSLNKT
jgi:cbb3-type cytochrome oxidase subunit 3